MYILSPMFTNILMMFRPRYIACIFVAKLFIFLPVLPVRAQTIENPLNVDTIGEFLAAILTIVMVLAVPVIIFFIVYAGFLYVTARGNSEQVQQATRAFTYAIIGGLIVLGAMVLVGIIQNLVESFGVDVE